MDMRRRCAQSDKDTWLRQVASGDLDAFNQLVLAYPDMAYNHARIILGDAILAEDATQECPRSERY